MAQKVFIGVGHGGKDPGAVANGFREKDLNLVIGLACQDELSRHGVLTKISRSTDEDESLTGKIRACNEYAPDLALDIHNNAGGGDGAEVYHSIYGGTGKLLAQNILEEMVRIGQNSRGTKTKKNACGSDYFGFIRQTKAPAVLVECAFVDNKMDIQIIDTEAEQKAMGVAIAKGILKTLGVAYREPDTESTVDNPQPEKTDPATSFNKAKAGIYKVRAASGLYLRHGAGVSKKAICLMTNGTKVTCYGYYTGKWLYVKAPDGSTGFCHSDYLTRL